MADLGNYSETKLVQHLYGVASFVMPSNIYLKLHIGAPGEDGTANPATETTRKAATFVAGAAPNAVDMSGDLDWTSYPAAETISHVSAWDSLGPAGGNHLGNLTLSAPKAVGVGDTFRLLAASTSFSLD